MKEDELVANDHQYRALYPILAEHLNLRDVVRTGPFVWPAEKGDIGPFDFLLRNDAQSALWRLYALHRNVTTSSGPQVSAAIDRIMALLHGNR